MTAPMVPPELVDAALRVAESLGKDVADVAVARIAAEAGMSRSTLLRRLGGARTVLDDAVRSAGVDPGGIPPVRIRAVDAAASLISESGLAAATLEAVAGRANCSVYGLHSTFGGRDELMRAVFERHSPIADIEEYLSHPGSDLPATVRGFYETVATALGREPRVAPAMIAEIFSRPTSPAVQSLAAYTGPRLVAVLSRWLGAEITAGRIRNLPLLELAQQLLGPMMIHVLMKPAAPALARSMLAVDTACDFFADAFVRAVATPEQSSPIS